MRKGPVFLSVTSSANLQALDATNRKLREVGKTAKTSSSGFKSFGKALGALGGAAAVVGLATKAVQEATEAFKVTATTETILRNTGLAASVSSKQIGDLAMQISNLTGIDDEQVQAASNVLLGIKGLVPAGKDAASTLANLTQVSADLGVKIGKDPVAGARLLAKALADPAKAVGALYRAGIPLDKQLADRVKALAKAGQLEQARALVLQQVQSSTKGLSAAVADPMTRLQTMFNNLLEVIGTPILDALTPVVTALQPVLSNFQPVLNLVGMLLARVVTALGKGLQPIIPVIIGLIEDLTPTFMALVDTVGALLPLVVLLTPSIMLLVKVLGKVLPIAIQGSTVALRILVMGIEKLLSMADAATKGFSKWNAPIHNAAVAAKSVVDQLGDIQNTDYSKLPDGLESTAVDYKGAAAALKAGAADASAAAKSVGAATGKKTATVKPKTATSPRSRVGDQSFTVAGSGGGLSLSVTVNGSVVQERDIARTIRDELLQFARRQGVSPQFGV